MARTKESVSSKAKVNALMNESVDINSPFLDRLMDVLVIMSPDYPGFPSLTLKEKINTSNYSLTKHERLFLMTSLKALEKVAFELRLNDLSALITEVQERISKCDELDAITKDAKDSLSTMD